MNDRELMPVGVRRLYDLLRSGEPSAPTTVVSSWDTGPLCEALRAIPDQRLSSAQRAMDQVLQDEIARREVAIGHRDDDDVSRLLLAAVLCFLVDFLLLTASTYVFFGFRGAAVAIAVVSLGLAFRVVPPSLSRLIIPRLSRRQEALRAQQPRLTREELMTLVGTLDQRVGVVLGLAIRPSRQDAIRRPYAGSEWLALLTPREWAGVLSADVAQNMIGVWAKTLVEPGVQIPATCFKTLLMHPDQRMRFVGVTHMGRTRTPNSPDQAGPQMDGTTMATPSSPDEASSA